MSAGVLANMVIVVIMILHLATEVNTEFIKLCHEYWLSDIFCQWVLMIVLICFVGKQGLSAVHSKRRGKYIDRKLGNSTTYSNQCCFCYVNDLKLEYKDENIRSRNKFKISLSKESTVFSFYNNKLVLAHNSQRD